MKITLSVVREVLHKALGFDSFIASFVTKVEEDANVPTACINAEGHMKYSPEFAGKFVTSTEDTFCLVMHELMHPLFCHYIYGGSEIANLAADAVINAAVTGLFPAVSGSGKLFKKLYKPEGVEAILSSAYPRYNSRFWKLHQMLYANHSSSDTMTTGELIQTLKILCELEKVIVLIGSHSDGNNKAEGAFGSEVCRKIAGEIKESMGNSAGFSSVLKDMLSAVLKTHLSLKKRLLSDYLTRRKIDRFVEQGRRPRRSTSPMPIHPGKKDTVLLAAGIWPGHFRNVLHKPQETRKGLAVFLDVSGSVNEHLPKIIGILRNMKEKMKSIYLFSNRVIETGFKELVEKGKVNTTYGTDFDCVARKILEDDFEKAVVITDGIASMNEENSEALKEKRVKILTVLYGGGEDCDDFEPFGPVVQLDDSTE